MAAKGTYHTSHYKHGHAIMFDGGKGYAYIDIAYDYTGHAVDVINCYDYAKGVSTQQSRADFLREVHEYLHDLNKHDADEYARA